MYYVAAEIRKTVLAGFDAPFDTYLAQAKDLKSLFSVLHDENFEVPLPSFSFLIYILSFSVDSSAGYYHYWSPCVRESRCCVTRIAKDPHSSHHRTR